MYLQDGITYYQGGEQRTGRGPFLLLLQTRDSEQIYACVRQVALCELGHFMMGRARIEGKTYSVSGAYGHDGLPMTVDRIPADAKLLPFDLREAWNSGGGWNGAGSEVPAMKQWARENLAR